MAFSVRNFYKKASGRISRTFVWCCGPSYYHLSLFCTITAQGHIERMPVKRSKWSRSRRNETIRSCGGNKTAKFVYINGDTVCVRHPIDRTSSSRTPEPVIETDRALGKCPLAYIQTTRYQIIWSAIRSQGCIASDATYICSFMHRGRPLYTARCCGSRNDVIVRVTPALTVKTLIRYALHIYRGLGCMCGVSVVLLGPTTCVTLYMFAASIP